MNFQEFKQKVSTYFPQASGEFSESSVYFTFTNANFSIDYDLESEVYSYFASDTLGYGKSIADAIASAETKKKASLKNAFEEFANDFTNCDDFRATVMKKEHFLILYPGMYTLALKPEEYWDTSPAPVIIAIPTGGADSGGVMREMREKFNKMLDF